MLTLHFKDYLPLCICSRFMYVKKQITEKYKYDISSGMKHIFWAIIKEHTVHIKNNIDIRNFLIKRR